MIDFIAGDEYEVTAILAYRLWEKRGRPIGSPEVDWFEAKNQLAEALAQDDGGIAVFCHPNGSKGRPVKTSARSGFSRVATLAELRVL